MVSKRRPFVASSVRWMKVLPSNRVSLYYSISFPERLSSLVHSPKVENGRLLPSCHLIILSLQGIHLPFAALLVWSPGDLRTLKSQ